MIKGKKVVVVMPAYNAARTLEQTYRDLPHDLIDDVVLVDDHSRDDTAAIAQRCGIRHIVIHDVNLGYGGNQKSCYTRALECDADIVLMIHPDYQYTPKLAAAMISLVADGVFDCVLGSRILGTGAIRGGMPVYKYVANRLLTFLQNLMIPYKLSEYHTGYRAFSREVLTCLPLQYNDDDFIFDNQMLLQIIYAGFAIGEVTCPTRYMEDSSSIGFMRALKYGFGVILTTVEYRLAKMHLVRIPRFSEIERTRR
jgi:glycosyltransferase involved in cell wall biosynthesis